MHVQGFNRVATEEFNKVQKLKGNAGVHRFIDVDGAKIGLLILNRGEQLFYQENDKAFICEMSARFGLIYLSSIKKWDNGNKITIDEKNKIMERMEMFYPKAYQDEVSFSK